MANDATNASGAIWRPNLQLKQVVPSGGQICNLCKWRHLMSKFATNVSGAMLFPSLIQVTESISGSVVPLAMFGQMFKLCKTKCCVSDGHAPGELPKYEICQGYLNP